MRNVLSIRYPKKKSNEDLYKKGQHPWWEKIRRGRVSFFGHMARLQKSTPARMAVAEFKNTMIKKLSGVQKLTWFKLVEKYLKPWV